MLFCQREAAETVDLPHRGRRPARQLRRLAQAARARQRGPQLGPAARGAEDGDRLGQDSRDGDADRLADPQQAVQSPRDARFTDRFLVVTPGITIRDRLRVLLPEDVENYYDLRDLIPADLKGGLEQARIVITNYHAFQLKDAKEIRGIAKNTRLLLKGDRGRTRSRRRRRRW